MGTQRSMGVVHRMIVCCAASVSMFAVVLCALVAVAAAQQPKPCQTPPQWQGKFERRADKFNATQYAEITYDETNKRVREVEFLVEGSNKTAYDVLYLHNVNEEYRIDLKTKNCTKHPLSRPFIPFGMPDGAHYVGAANVGPVNIPDEHATVHQREDRIHAHHVLRHHGRHPRPHRVHPAQQLRGRAAQGAPPQVPPLNTSYIINYS